MRIPLLRIKKFLGIDELVVELGKVTVVKGKNARGKSSVVEALRFAFEGGQNATLRRNGEEDGEVVIVLDNGVEVARKLKVNGSTTTSVKHPEMGKIGAPQTYLGSLFDAISINPVKIITADPKDRAEIILSSMPLKVSRGDLQEAIGDVYELPDGPYDGHALHTLDAVKKILYDERTGVNRLAKQASTFAEEMRRSLPSPLPDTAVIESEIEMHLSLKESREQRAKKRIESLQGEKQKVLQKIEALKQQALKIEDSINSETNECAADIHPIEVDIEVLRERLESAKRSRGAVGTIKEKEREAASHQANSKALTDAMARLDGLRGKLMKDLPINFDIGEDGDIVEDGVPFPIINTQRQAEIAMEIAALRAKEREAPLVCVDGLELLDSEHFEAVVEWAKKNDSIQFVMTRVTDDEELTIEQA